MRGFASIGLTHPKNAGNIGSVIRAAHCYDAAFVAVEGARCRIPEFSDTGKGYKSLPVLRGDDLFAMMPFGTVPVAVDLVEGAVSLTAFQHPMNAFYVFGPEDGTLGHKHLARCVHRVMVPTKHCMNLAATVNVVLYDRMAKHERVQRSVRYRDLQMVAAE